MTTVLLLVHSYPDHNVALTLPMPEEIDWSAEKTQINFHVKIMALFASKFSLFRNPKHLGM